MAHEIKDQDMNEDEKSSAPLHSIDYCLSMIKEVINQRGENYFSKKDASVVLGKSESNLSTKLGASGQYGILINERGKGYKPSSLFQKIEFPSSIEQKQATQLKVFANPAVYKKLIDAYNGKVLPANEDMFSNLLVTDYGMIKASADKAAKIFIENAKSLGIIDSSNRLRYIIPSSNGDNIDSTPSTSEGNPDGNNTPPKPSGMIEILIPLKGSGRKALLHIPEEYKDEDLTRIAKFVDALKDE